MYKEVDAATKVKDIQLTSNEAYGSLHMNTPAHEAQLLIFEICVGLTPVHFIYTAF